MFAPDSSKSSLQGFISALVAFGLWGLFPIYFKWLDQVSALEVLGHRVLWSVPILCLLILYQNKFHLLLAEFRSRKRLSIYLLTTALISVNWLIYIWAVQNDRVLEASMGYYINPLVNVILGVFVLKESLNRKQGLAVALATIGVLWMVLRFGAVPWISLALAASFGSYGLLRKKVGMDGAVGLLVETLLLTPLVLIYIAWLSLESRAMIFNGDGFTQVLLVMAGLITVIPLVMFMNALSKLRLATVGLIQYLTPTLQFLLAVLVYRESFTTDHLITFMFIWAALAVYSADAWWTRRRPQLNRL